jgi:hypothetical protein
MSSAFSTITSNVNLLLVNSSIISLNAPYIAYVSSTSIPGRIATVRDAVGLVSSPGCLIIVSTLKDVRFSDGTSSITISQPFGYISLSSRDKYTWDVINTFAFPMPSPVSYVSSIFATDGIIANSYLSRTYVSTQNLITDSISSYRIQASTISTANLFSQNISTQNFRGFNNIFTNVSTQTASTNLIFANTISSISSVSRNLVSGSLTLSNTTGNASITLSNDLQALLVNGIPTGTFRAISTATTTLNMNNNSISNIDILSSINLTSSNISIRNANIVSLSTFNLQIQNLSSASTVMNSLAVNSLFSNSVNSIQVNTDINMCNNSINTINTLNTSNINVTGQITTSVTSTDYIKVNTLASIIFSNTINMSNNSMQNIADLSANNILALDSIKSKKIISAVDISCNNIFNCNSYIRNVYTEFLYLSTNYKNINSAQDIIGGARQNFINLFDVSGGFNTLLSHTNSNENNSIKIANVNGIKIWNIDVNLNITTNGRTQLQTYFTLFNLTQNKEYYFDTYNPSNYFGIDLSGSLFNSSNRGKLVFSDTFYGDFNNNDKINMKGYFNASNSLIKFVNSDLSGAWNTPTTTFPSDNYLCAAYANNTWIVGSSNNTLYKSTDNATTFTNISLTINPVLGVAYGNNIWVIVGNGTSSIFTSIDNGNNWNQIVGTDFNTCMSVAYGNGVFVAVGNTNTSSNIQYSTDGSNWSNIQSGNNFSVEGTCVRFFNNRFIAVGNDSGSVNTIQYSDNGINWTSVASTTFPLNRIPRAIGYGGGRWYIAGDSNIYTSSNNGVSWNVIANAATTTESWNGIYVGEGIILTSYAGTSANTHFWYSLNGLTTIVAINGNTTPQPFYGVEYGNHTYLAFGSNTVYKRNAVNYVNYSLQPAAIQPAN